MYIPNRYDCCCGACRAAGSAGFAATAADAAAVKLEGAGLRRGIGSEAGAPAPLLQPGFDGPVLLRGGCVLSMDRAIGDFPSADVLIRGSRIAEIRPGIEAPDALVVDAAGMIVMPGFIDNHRHCWQTVLRRSASNATFGSYAAAITRILEVIRPEDVFIGNLLACYGAIDSGTTTLLDWSHVSKTPEHSDAAVEALFASGMRAVYGYGYARGGVGTSNFPDDAGRIRKTYFSAPSLVEMCMAANIDQMPAWSVGRDLGLRISGHVFRVGHGALVEAAGRAGQLGPDVTLIHCTPDLDDAAWRAIRDNGVSLSLATSSVAQLGVGTGVPPIQKALDHGIRPSLSIDIETALAGDFFSLMRATLSLQRSGAHELLLKGAEPPPRLLSVRDVLEFATVEGAKALGLEHRIGTLAPGKEADIILIDAGALNVLPLNNAPGTVVLGADTGNVRAVFVAGKLKKWGDTVLEVDLSRLAHLAESSRDWLAEHSGLRLDLFGDGY